MFHALWGTVGCVKDVVVREVAERRRYEAVVGGVVAGFVTYRDMRVGRTFLHTEVDEDFEGRGVGSALARGALDDARARQLSVRPSCPFVAGWIRRHQDYLDVVAGDLRAQVLVGS
jgi:predicted GNAT family acetyltransferase